MLNATPPQTRNAFPHPACPVVYKSEQILQNRRRDTFHRKLPQWLGMVAHPTIPALKRGDRRITRSRPAWIINRDSASNKHTTIHTITMMEEIGGM
jgi:hypothetical protein